MKQQEEKRLYIIYNERRQGGEPESDEPYSRRAPTYIDVQFTALLKEQLPDRMFYHSVIVDDKTFKNKIGYLAVVRYSTGNTFGRTEGAWEVIGCYSSYKKAQKMLDNAINGSEYKVWEGYFESFERTEIHALPIS